MKIRNAPLWTILFLALTILPDSMAFAAGAARPDSPRADFEERRRFVAETMEAATVWIVVEDDESIAVDSGFIVADGFIATNAHVVNDIGKKGLVYVLNERIPPRKAKVVNMIYEDKSGGVGGRDFALLRFDPPKGANLPALSFNFDVKRMDRVSAWGYPAMATQFDISTQRLQEGDTSRLEPPPVVYTEGTVNTIVRDSAGISILHSASIAGGNSGGPLVNGRGELVGINTWGYKAEDEGAFLNGAQTASELAHFLIDNGVTPSLAPGQQMTNRPKKSEGERAGGKAPSFGGGLWGRTQEQEERRDVGAFSVVVPRGWSVLDEEDDRIFLGADDDSAAVGIMLEEMEGMRLRQAARALSKELGGSSPQLDDDVYHFTYTDDDVETMVFIGEGGEDDQYVVIFVSGDGDNPGVSQILNNIE